MKDTLSLIGDEALETRDSLPRPNWKVINSWAEANVEPALMDETWTQIARDWLNRLTVFLPSGYTLHESTEFMVLVSDEIFADRVLRWCENAREKILQTLDAVASDSGLGKHVVLVFDDAERYYDYITDFYPDQGEFGLSAGIFIDAGYGHFAICNAYGDDIERVIAHELNHALIRHLPLPIWLNEGVTQFMEDVVLDASQFLIDPEIVGRHRSYWNTETIHSFWSGDSFFFANEGQELSYHLSQVLFRNLMSDFPNKVTEILKHAHFSDAGNGAFEKVCNVNLVSRIAQFLGQGSWDSRSDYILPND